MVLELFGWSAAIGFLVGYWLFNESKINLFWYNVINVVTAFTYVAYNFSKAAYPGALINLILGVITIKFLWTKWQTKNTTKKEART